MTHRQPTARFLDDEGDVFVRVSEAGVEWWGDSRSPNWGGGYGIGEQTFAEYLRDGPMKPTPAEVQREIDSQVRVLAERGFAGVERWGSARAREHLASGLDLSLFDSRGQTLLYAMPSAFTAQLLAAGADPRARNPKTGATALHEAARCSAREKITLLLRAGAELEARDGEGLTPLVHALQMVGRGEKELRLATVRQLLDAGADASQTLPDGTSAADVLGEEVG